MSKCVLEVTNYTQIKVDALLYCRAYIIKSKFYKEPCSRQPRYDSDFASHKHLQKTCMQNGIRRESGLLLWSTQQLKTIEEPCDCSEAGDALSAWVCDVALVSPHLVFPFPPNDLLTI
jgi:hypothetical protein